MIHTMACGPEASQAAFGPVLRTYNPESPVPSPASFSSLIGLEGPSPGRQSGPGPGRKTRKVKDDSEIGADALLILAGDQNTAAQIQLAGPTNRQISITHASQSLHTEPQRTASATLMLPQSDAQSPALLIPPEATSLKPLSITEDSGQARATGSWTSPSAFVLVPQSFQAHEESSGMAGTLRPDTSQPETLEGRTRNGGADQVQSAVMAETILQSPSEHIDTEKAMFVWVSQRLSGGSPHSQGGPPDVDVAQHDVHVIAFTQTADFARTGATLERQNVSGPDGRLRSKTEPFAAKMVQERDTARYVAVMDSGSNFPNGADRRTMPFASADVNGESTPYVAQHGLAAEQLACRQVSPASDQGISSSADSRQHRQGEEFLPKGAPSRGDTAPQIASLTSFQALVSDGASVPHPRDSGLNRSEVTRAAQLSMQNASDVHAARALERELRSDLQIGVQTEAFGRVTIHTVNEGGQLAAHLSLENGRGSASLSAQLPDAERRIQHQYGLNASVSLIHQGPGNGGGPGGGERYPETPESKTAIRRSRMSIRSADQYSPAENVRLPSHSRSVDGRLDVRA